MSPRPHAQPIQHVYRERGETERTLACAPIDPSPARWPSVADLVPITQIMTREVYCARPELDLGALADLMVEHHVGCIPIVNELGCPTGMVTKIDLVERLLANARDPRVERPRAARDVMMPMAITLHDRATVAHAAALMSSEGIHHIVVVDADGCAIGIVSTLDVTRWLASNDGFTPPPR